MNTRFNAIDKKRMESRATSELIGIAKGLIADEKLTEQEADFLCSWLSKNTEHYGIFPFNILFDRIETMLSDNIIDEEERKELFELLTELTGEKKVKEEFDNFTTTLPLTKPCPKITFLDRKFCFTGTFVYERRKDYETAVLDRGGDLTPYVIMDLDYLVVGSKPTKDWKQSSFGNKIIKAVEYNNKGRKIAIISEKDLLAAINNTTSIFSEKIEPNKIEHKEIKIPINQPKKQITDEKNFKSVQNKENDTTSKIICPFCKKEIDAKEKICPYCETNFNYVRINKKLHKIFIGFVIFMVAFVIFSYAFF